MKTLVALLVIGFIPVLIISWVFELTPDRLRREDESAPADSTQPNIAQALGYFAFDKFLLAPAPMAKTLNSQVSMVNSFTLAHTPPRRPLASTCFALLTINCSGGMAFIAFLKRLLKTATYCTRVAWCILPRRTR